MLRRGGVTEQVDWSYDKHMTMNAQNEILGVMSATN